MTRDNRTALAFVAALVSAPVFFLLFALTDTGAPSVGGDFYSDMAGLIFIVGYGVILCFFPAILALAVYSMLRDRYALRWRHFALAGAVTGGLPMLLLGSGFNEIGIFAIIGLCAALVFRAVLGPDPHDRIAPGAENDG